MTTTSKLDTVLAESTAEVRGYLREHLNDIILAADNGLHALARGDTPISVASRLLDEAQHIVRLTGTLVNYAEIADLVEER